MKLKSLADYGDFEDARVAIDFLHDRVELSFPVIAEKVPCTRITIWRLRNRRNTPSERLRKDIQKLAKRYWRSLNG